MHPEALDLEAGRPTNDGSLRSPSFEDDRPSTPSGVYTANVGKLIDSSPAETPPSTKTTTTMMISWSTGLPDPIISI